MVHVQHSPYIRLLLHPQTPSAAASGAIAANTMNSVDKHISLLKEASQRDPLYKFLDPGPLAEVYKLFVGGLTPSPELRVEQEASASAEQ